MDQVAENMEKSFEVSEKVESSESLEKAELIETIRSLNPEKLKKAQKNLSDAQKELLKSILEEMAKSHTQPVKNPKQSAEPKTNTTPNGDYYKNEAKIDQVYQDEVVMNEIEKDKQQKHKHQGDNSPEAFEGEMIKAEAVKEEEPEMEKGDSQPDESAQVRTSEQMSKMKKKCKMKKSEFLPAVERMLEREMSKEVCVPALAKALETEEEKVSFAWEAIEKAYKAKQPMEAKEMTAEADQVSPPDCMKKEEKGSKPKADATVPASETKVEKMAEQPMSGESQESPDEGEQPKKTMKKSFDGLKKASNPFAYRTVGQRYHAFHTSVDEEIEKSMESLENMAKGAFSWDIASKSEEEMKKSMDVNDYIEKGMDIASDAYERSVEEVKEEGPKLVKSFSDEDMLVALHPADHWGKGEEVVGDGEKPLVKGEGSNGGKVIGHTKSGKPIYAKKDRSKMTENMHKEVEAPIGYLNGLKNGVKAKKEES